MKKTAIQNFNKISFGYLFVKRCLLTFLCFSLLGITPKVFAQAAVPCNLRVVNNSTFKYTGTGAAPSRWNVSQADTGGTTIDHTAYSYQGTGNLSPQNLNPNGTPGTNNSTRQYAIVTNPNTLSPQYANIPTDGMLVINPLQGQNDQYISYTVNGLVPGNTYYVEMKLWNVIDMAMPGACGQWCNWNDQVEVQWTGNANNANDGQSGMTWAGTNGTGNWDGYGNQIGNMLKISSGGASAVMSGQVTLANATTGFTIVLKKGNSINPIVLGIDYLKVMGCKKEAINVSGGSNTVCQLTNLTLTAQGIGSAAASYSWYQNGTLMPGRNADTLNIISPATVGAQDVYKAVGDYDNISTTITSRLCCSSVGGTQDEIYRQSFNALPYVCTGGRSGGYADVPNKTANIVEPSYIYSGTSCDGLNDGHYAVVQSSFAGDYWRTRPEVKEHTGTAGSGALFINATGSAGQIFYQSNLSGLCNSTTYEFSLWYASLATGSEIVPNLEFDIYQGSTLVATTQSGTIPNNEQWFQASVTFSTPSSGTGVYTLKIVNLATGTLGNDLMLDDIIVKKCTPSINVYQNGTMNDTALSVCSNAQVKLVVKTAYDLPLEITGSSSGTVYYQWMSASSPNAADGTWTLLGAPETTGSYLATPSVSIVYYRAKVSATSAAASTGLLPKATDCGNDGITSSFKLTQAGSVTIGSTSPRTQNICFGTAPASDITLVGNTSGVVRWEYSTDKTFTTGVTQVSNTTITYKATDIQALNLAANSTTYFHALVNGCSAGSTITTDSAMIIVIPASVGGTTASAQTVCYNTAPATDITLSGNVGNVTKWQSSTDVTFATGVTDIANTTTTLTKAAIGSLTTNTYYRAVVQSGVGCVTANSTAVLITVSPASVGGTIAPVTQNVCSGNTPTTDLTLSGNVGSVTKWQSSTDMTFATGVTDIANTTTTLTKAAIGNLSTTTYYRAAVQSGTGCTIVYSTISAIVVTSATRGTLSGNSQTICYKSSPASNLVVTGNTNNSTGWEYSTSATFATGVSTIANSSSNTLNTTDIGALQLTTNTYFRAIVAGCVAGTFLRTDSILITVTPASVGGTTASAQTVCYNTAPATDITLSGNVGNVTKWQSSTDITFATGVTDIANTTTTLTKAAIGSLTTNTYYRAVVQSGAGCTTANSTAVLITVTPASVGGTIAPATQNVCSGNAASTNLTLSGNVGSVTKWQSSTDMTFATGVTDIANTTTTLNGSSINVTTTTYYRAAVQSGAGCTIVYSTISAVVVTSATRGTLSGNNQTICYQSSPASNLLVTGNTSASTGWEYSTSATFGSGITTIGNSSPNTLSTAAIGSLALTTNTYFRAVVPGCVAGTFLRTDSILITVTPASVGGTTASAQTVCYNTAPATDITLSGNVGNVTKWQSSTDITFATGVTDIANTTTTLTKAAIGNLTTNTYYRAVVQSGAGCTTANSTAVLITVSPASVGGTIAPATQNVCSGNTPTTDLTLSGNVGSVTKWQSSTDMTFATGVTNIANTTTTLTKAAIGNLSTTTYYRAAVQSGAGCTTVYSTISAVVVTSATRGTLSSNNQTICYKSSPASNLVVTGNTNNSTGWEYSTSATFATGVSTLANSSVNTLSTTDIGALNLTTNTYFRAIVAGCVAGTFLRTDSILITVTPASVGGTTASAQTVCYNTAPATDITLSGNVGNVTKWQSSTDITFATGVTDIANTTTTLTKAAIGSLTTNTYYRAVVQSGVGCLTANSTAVLITVTPASVGGIIAPATQNVCTGSTPTTDLTLSGNVGNVTKWQSSADKLFGSGVIDITNTSTTLSKTTIGNVTATTYYRAVVQSGVGCAIVYSDSSVIVVTSATRGTLSSNNQTICYKSSPASNLVVTGNTNNSTGWEYTTDATFATGIITIANSSANTLNTTDIGALKLTTNTYFRSIVAGCVAGTFLRTDSILITVTPASVGGTTASAQTVCYNTAPATDITLSGNVGNVTKWQSSTDITFATGVTDIANTTTTLTKAAIGSLTTNTYYRAVVQSGVGCLTANSTAVLITVTPASVGGIIAPATQNVCTGSTPTTDLTLSGNVGNVTKWQSSADKLFGSGVIDITNTSTTLSKTTIGNVTATTYYRAVVQSGVGCAIVYSDSSVIVVTSATRGTLSSNNQTICYKSSPASNLVVTGNTNNSTGWEYTTDATFATGVITIANSSANTLNTTDIGALKLTANTYFRAVVAGCVPGTFLRTDSILITVTPASVGGTTASAQTVCYNTAPATDITLSGNVGNVTKWQSSSDITFATGVTDIANTTTTLTKAVIGSLTTNTYYRAVVQSGVGCVMANSTAVLITVTPASVGGIIAPATQNVCTGSTPTTDLTLSGNVGNVTKWQSSADKLFGSGVIDIANTSTTLSKTTIGNVTATTYYRAVVQSGAGCAIVYSDSSVIVVTSATRGTLSSNNQTICYQSSPASNLVVTGNTNNSTGWEYTTDATFATGINTIANSTANTLTTTDIGALKLTTNTYFRSIVAGCVAGTFLRTDSILITVTPASVGGTTASAQTVCYNTAPATDITLSGNVGNVTKWQSSTDITFATGVTDIANTTTTLTKAAIGSLTTNTYYRAVVQSGVGCLTANSTAVLITVTPASVGGIIAPATQNVCTGSTPTTDLTLSGNVGNVTKWQSSPDKLFAIGVTDIANTTNTLPASTIGNLIVTTYYRAVSVSGAGCTPAYSDSSVIVVTSATRGTLSNNNQTICYQSSPASNLVVTGNTNNSTGWEYTTDATFATGISTIANSSANTLNTTDIGALKLTANTYFRAVVAGCVPGTFLRTDSILITVTPASVGGLISGMPASQICYGSTPPNDLSLSGNIGNVLRWEYSTDKTFATANIKSITPNISSTTLPKASIGNLKDSTYFRAVVQSGTVAQGCNIAYSDTVLIPVQPISKGGNVTPAVQTICSGLIPTTDLTLTGNTGPVVNWQQSTNANFSGATTIANTSNTLTTTQIGQLSTSTYYRAVVTACSGTINSDSALIQVNPTPVLTITPPASVCAGLTVDITKPSVTANSTLPASTQPFQYYKDAALTSPQSNPNAIGVSGNYYIRAFTALGCSDTALVPVSITPLPAQPTANDVAYCQGATASLLTASGANSTFTWYAQLSGGAVVTPLPSTATGGVTLLYYVTQTDANNCESDPRVKVSVRITTSPTASINMPIPYLTYHGTVVTLDGRATGGNILWTSSNQNEIIATPTIQNPAVTPAGNTDGTSPIRITTYTMTVTAAENTLCTATSSVDITVIEHLIIPNSFSPNGDGINDVWHIGNISEFTNAEVSIFNRYGQFVADQKGGYNIPWDGKLNGQDLPEGTYFYIIKTTPGAKPIAGSISIIR